MSSNDKKRGLARNMDDAWLGGVASGISDATDGYTPTQVRMAFVVFSFAFGLGLLAYTAAWLYMPSRPGSGSGQTSVLGATNRELVMVGGVVAAGVYLLFTRASLFTWLVWIATMACAAALAIRRAEYVGPEGIEAGATDTYNPIIARWQSSLERVRRRPLPEPGRALVLYGEHGYLGTLWQERAAQDSEQWRRARTIFRVDVSQHTIAFTAALPSSGDAFSFTANVTLVCSVTEPRLIVESNTIDVAGTLRPLVEKTMRDVSRRFRAEQSAQAEESIREAVLATEYGVGLRIDRFVPEVKLDDASREHLRTLTGLDRQREQNRVSSQVEVERTRQELELDSIRVEYYRGILSAGQVDSLALQISRNPDEIPQVAEIIRTTNTEYRQWLDQQLEQLYERDGLEAHDLEVPARVAIQRLTAELGRGEPPAGQPRQLGT